MKRFDKFLPRGGGKIKPFLFGVTVTICCFILIGEIHSYAGVSDNVGSGYIKLAQLLGFGKEDSVPNNQQGFESATMIEKINYLESKVSVLEKKLGEVPQQTVVLQGSGVNTSTAQAREALTKKGFVLIKTKTTESGRTLYGFIKTNSQERGTYRESEKYASEYYKQVNDWSSKNGYGTIAVSSSLPSKLDIGGNKISYDIMQNIEHMWLLRDGCIAQCAPATEAIREYIDSQGNKRKYYTINTAEVSDCEYFCCPIVWIY